VVVGYGSRFFFLIRLQHLASRWWSQVYRLRWPF
jgi:hypothetical protein